MVLETVDGAVDRLYEVIRQVIKNRPRSDRDRDREDGRLAEDERAINWQGDEKQTNTDSTDVVQRARKVRSLTRIFRDLGGGDRSRLGGR